MVDIFVNWTLLVKLNAFFFEPTGLDYLIALIGDVNWFNLRVFWLSGDLLYGIKDLPATAINFSLTNWRSSTPMFDYFCFYFPMERKI